jgi:hypothetical protein
MQLRVSSRRGALQHASLAAVIIVTGGIIPVSASAAPTAYQNAVLTNTPYVYYRLGESSGTTASDSSGNNRPGTYVNSPTLATAGAGAGDTAATFASASSQYVASNQLAAFGREIGSASWEFVFSTTSTAQMALGGNANTGSATNWEVTLNRSASGSASASGVRLFLRDDGGNAIGAAFTAANAFDGTFHNLVFTYDMDAATGTTAADNAARVRAYLDGVEQTLSFASMGGNQRPGTGALSDFAFDTRFATRPNTDRSTNTAYLDGTIDEIALYTTVLSLSDVVAHAQALSTSVPEPASLSVLGLGAFALAARRRRTA